MHSAKMNLIPLGVNTWMFSFSCNKKQFFTFKILKVPKEILVELKPRLQFKLPACGICALYAKQIPVIPLG
jgi:hypothetical protein